MTETLTDRLRAASEVAYEEEMCLLITKEDLAHAAAEIERLTAEVERLRAALRQINEIELEEYGPDYAEIEKAQIIASAALGADNQQQAVCQRCGGTGVEKAIAGDGHHWCPDCNLSP